MLYFTFFGLAEWCFFNKKTNFSQIKHCIWTSHKSFCIFCQIVESNVCGCHKDRSYVGGAIWALYLIKAGNGFVQMVLVCLICQQTETNTPSFEGQQIDLMYSHRFWNRITLRRLSILIKKTGSNSLSMIKSHHIGGFRKTFFLCDTAYRRQLDKCHLKLSQYQSFSVWL